VAIVGGGKSEEQAATQDQHEDEPLSRGFFADPANRVDLGTEASALRHSLATWLRRSSHCDRACCQPMGDPRIEAVAGRPRRGDRRAVRVQRPLRSAAASVASFSGGYCCHDATLAVVRPIRVDLRVRRLADRWLCGVAALLSPHGVLELRPDRYDGSTWHLFEAYAWNLADAVPVLRVSQTLNWREPLKF
jgi:hypothetical protein